MVSPCIDAIYFVFEIFKFVYRPYKLAGARIIFGLQSVYINIVFVQLVLVHIIKTYLLKA